MDDAIRSVLLSKSLYSNKSKKIIKNELSRELPNIKKKWLYDLVDHLILFDKVHGDGYHYAMNHMICNSNHRMLMKKVGLTWDDIKKR